MREWEKAAERPIRNEDRECKSESKTVQLSTSRKVVVRERTFCNRVEIFVSGLDIIESEIKT